MPLTFNEELSSIFEMNQSDLLWMAISNATSISKTDYFVFLESAIQNADSLDPLLISKMIKLAPYRRELQDLSLISIHRMIPRWTPSKYHTAPIDSVLNDIQKKIRDHETGLYLYNSNLNVRNDKSPNDPYVLLVDSENFLFVDINRKRIFSLKQQDTLNNL